MDLDCVASALGELPRWRDGGGTGLTLLALKEIRGASAGQVCLGVLEVVARRL